VIWRRHFSAVSAPNCLTADYLLTLARLTVLDWLVPPPETPTDRAIREEGERLRKAFPEIDFDHPNPRRRGDLRS
jgi:hypothetical protein